LTRAHRVRSLPLACALLCAPFLAHAWWYDFVSDDAFIVLRYARNLAQGSGLVFNPGERVEGFTSPTWILLMAPVEFAGLDAILVARLLGLLAGMATIVAAVPLSRRLMGPGASPAWSLFAPALLAANGSFACWAPAGLETSLFTLLVTAAFLAAVGGRALTAAALAALCIFTRPEGAVVFAVLAGGDLLGPRTDRLARLRYWAVPLLALAALTAFRLAYYGDPVPNTFYAKTGGTWAQWYRGLGYVGEYASDHEGLPLMLTPVLFSLAAGDARLRLIAAGVLALWAEVVWVGGDGLPMYRFMLPPLPLALVLQGVLLQRLLAYAAKAFPLGWGARVVGAIAFATLVAVHLSPPLLGGHYLNYQYQQAVEVPRWRRVGLWLREHSRPGDSLAAVPIGAVSYYSGLISYDMLGLTDRHIARRELPSMGQGWPGHEKHDGQYILGRRPTYILAGNIDVTPAPRQAGTRPFIPYENPNVFERERDLFDSDLIDRLYEGRSVPLGTGEYLNFYQLKDENRGAAG